MPRVAIPTTDAPAPFGPYSQSVRIGGVAAAAGQVGVSPDGELRTGIEQQTRQALDNLLAVLKAAGASADDVIQVGVFLVDPSHFAAVNEVYKEYFADPLPARTAVYVTLPPEVLIEVDALAVIQG